MCMSVCIYIFLRFERIYSKLKTLRKQWLFQRVSVFGGSDLSFTYNILKLNSQKYSHMLYVQLKLGFPWSPKWLKKKIHLPMQETWVRSLGWEDLLEKEMATLSSILAWEIPWTEGPGEHGITKNVRHNLATEKQHSKITLHLYVQIMNSPLNRMHFSSMLPLFEFVLSLLFSCLLSSNFLRFNKQFWVLTSISGKLLISLDQKGIFLKIYYLSKRVLHTTV